VCLLDDPMGDIADCHQHDPDHCDSSGGCDPTQTLLDISGSGSHWSATSEEAADVFDWGSRDVVLTRPCDSVVTLRVYSEETVNELRRAAALVEV
jgi:hypothetical protein